MIDPREVKISYDLRNARREAVKRASFKCPVIKAANRALDKARPMDTRHAIDVLTAELQEVPEAAATLALVLRVQGYDKGANNGE